MEYKNNETKQENLEEKINSVNKKNAVVMFIPLGIGVGTALGVAFGRAYDKLTIGLAIGISAGLCLGVLPERYAKLHRILLFIPIHLILYPYKNIFYPSLLFHG